MNLSDTERELILTSHYKASGFRSMTSLAKDIGMAHSTYIRVVRAHQALLNACQWNEQDVQVSVSIPESKCSIPGGVLVPIYIDRIDGDNEKHN